MLPISYFIHFDMEADSHYSLETTFICSNTPETPHMINASFKASDDLIFDGMPGEYCISSLTRMQGSQYVLNGNGVYITDVETLKV